MKKSFFLTNGIKQLKKPFLKIGSFNIVLVFIISFVVVILLNNLRFFYLAELKSIDFRFTGFSNKEKADTNIVLAAIDQNSLEFFEKEMISWPWPREFYSVLVDYLYDCGAKAIIFDIDFSSGEIERGDVDPVLSEKSFASSIERSRNVVLTTILKNIERGDQPGNKILEKHRLKLDLRNRNYPSYNSSSSPLYSFQNGAQKIGAVNIIPDEDGIIRRIPLVYKINNFNLVNLSLSAFSFVNKISDDRLDSVLNIIPTDRNNYLIHWYGEGGPNGVFNYYSIHSMIVSGYKIKEGLQPDIPKSTFRNKTVIVGGTAFGLMDYKPVPFHSYQGYPGMEIHATVLSNFNKEDFMYQVPDWIVYPISAFFSFFVVLIFFRIKKASFAVSLILLIGIVYFLSSLLFFNQLNLIIPLIIPETTIIISLVFSAIVSYEIEGRKKRELKKIFSRYLSANVVDELTANPDQVDLTGKEVEATVFFSDIKNFTTISEKFPPKDLVFHLNAYFAVCTDIILKHNAMLDKYIGDAVMAIFGVPFSKNNHAAEACLAALEIQKSLKRYFENSDKKKTPVFETRIGINTGKMIVGNIGTESHLDYTVIGDSVNLSSRLEGVNKLFSTEIIISEYTYLQAKDFIEVRELDDITVKGKELPVKIYELLAEKGALSIEKMNEIKYFEEGLNQYKEQNWEASKENFNKVLITNPTDKAARVYIERCNVISKQKIPDGWKGISNYQIK